MQRTFRSLASSVWRFWLQHPIRFRREMDTYFKSHCTTNGTTARDPNLIALVENGFVVLRQFHDEARIRRIHDKAISLLEQVKNKAAPPEWKFTEYREDGIYRLKDIETLLPEARFVLDNPYLRSLVSSYLGSKVRVVGDYIDYKPDIKHDYTSVLHMDSVKSQLKIFTLLSDVREGNAPMVYWSKTHLDRPWRRPFDYLFWKGAPIGIHGHVPVTPLREMRDKGGADAPSEHLITGCAGTVVIADTRGIHRASCLVEGYRLEIVQKFSEG